MSSFFIQKTVIEGIVCNKKKDSIWIIPENPNCSSEDCKVGCGSCSYAKSKKKIRICVEDISQVECGERVAISTIKFNEAIAALIVFGLPILLMLLSIFLWDMLSTVNIDSPKVIISSLLAFIVGFIIVREIDLIFRKKFPVKTTDIKKLAMLNK